MFKQKKDQLSLGNKRVEIPKLTRNRLKKLTEHIGSIGDFIVKLFLTPEEKRAVFIVAGSDLMIDEIYEITSLLSDLPIQYLDEHASLAECTEYLRLTWEKNDMEGALGNAQSLLHPMAKEFVTSIVKGLKKVEKLQSMNSLSNVL